MKIPKMLKQRLIGLAMIAISVIIICVAMSSNTAIPEDSNITGVMFTLPIGLYAVCAKRCIFIFLGQSDNNLCK